jgi:FAD:protein FMN transferase
MRKTFPYFAIFLLAVSCSPREAFQKVGFNGLAQGTYYAVTYYDQEGRNFQAGIDSLLRAFDMSVSMWEPNSVISRINRGEDSVICDEVFINTYLLARKVAGESGGAFDFTIGPLVNAWGFGAEGRREISQVLIDSLLPFIGYEMVRLEGSQIIVEKDGIRFDFNAVAQGYSVDLTGAYLASKGIENFLVDIGGEVLACGEKPGEGRWVVGVERPAEHELSERQLETMVYLKDRAMATSGNYRKFYEEDGIRYSHTIDPQTGYPVTHTLLSVSVVAGDCGTADAWATAFMVMGIDKALKVLETNDGLDAFFIYSGSDGSMQTYATEGLKELMLK